MLFSTTAIHSSVSERIDALFAEFNPSTPGCSVAAARHGQIFYTGSFGAANLEHNVANGPNTRFNAASVSKQFTAAAVALLSLDGKISLDESIRRYFPELPTYAEKITIRQLIHHTSGLRDYSTLLVLKGSGLHNAVTSQEVMDLITRQKDTNFEPGTEYLYSNSGYFLLGELVARVTKNTLKAFTSKRIFARFEMPHSHFNEDHMQLIPNRAEGYLKSNCCWTGNRSRFAQVGAGGLFTTATDLLTWNVAMYTSESPLARLLLTRGRLSSGEELPYAFGLVYGEHNRLTTIGHGGNTGGYRSYLTWYPDQNFSVAVLCNLDTIDTHSMANQIAEIVLADKMSKSEPVKRVAIEIERNFLKYLSGSYTFAPNFIINITRRGKQLFAQATDQSKHPIYPESRSKFFYRNINAQISFTFGSNRLAQEITLHQNGANLSGKRIKKTVKGNRPLEEYVGEYYNDELDTYLNLFIEDGNLWSHIGYSDPWALRQTAQDEFTANIASIRMQSDATGHIRGMLLNTKRVRDIYYERR